MKTFHPFCLFTALLISLVILSNCTPASGASPQKDMVGYLQVLAENGFSGAVLVAQDGKVILSEGYGLADKQNGIPVTPEIVFDTGSLSKQFTAAAILHLQEQGLLQLTDTLPKFFKDVPPDKTNITLHQLLTHSSGLPEYVYDGDFVEISREAAVQRALAAQLEFEPGTKYMYSDTGYGMLAAIVEVVSGQSFQDYLHQHLFKPAGMEATGFYNEPRWTNLTVAHGYHNDQDLGSAATRPGPAWGLLGFGGVLSTVGDLYRWHLALEQRRVLSAGSVEKLFTPYIDEGNDGESYYGYGWVIMEVPELGKIIWHDGATDSQNAIFLNSVDHRTVVIVLANRIDGVMDDEVFYGTETGFSLGRSILTNDFSEYPDYVR